MLTFWWYMQELDYLCFIILLVHICRNTVRSLSHLSRMKFRLRNTVTLC